MRRNFFSRLDGLRTQSDILICGNFFRLEKTSIQKPIFCWTHLNLPTLNRLFFFDLAEDTAAPFPLRGFTWMYWLSSLIVLRITPRGTPLVQFLDEKNYHLTLTFVYLLSIPLLSMWTSFHGYFPRHKSMVIQLDTYKKKKLNDKFDRVVKSSAWWQPITRRTIALILVQIRLFVFIFNFVHRERRRWFHCALRQKCKFVKPGLDPYFEWSIRSLTDHNVECDIFEHGGKDEQETRPEVDVKGS